MAEPAPAPEPTPAPAPAPEPAPAPTPEPAPAPTGAEWRAALKSDDAKKFAETSPDLDHLVTRALDMRQKLSTAITVPGKDAKPDSPEVIAYRKALDIPADPKGYLADLARPDFVDEETWKGEHVQTLLGGFAERMHAAGAPKAAVQAAIAFELEMEAAVLKQTHEADKKFAAESEAALKGKWGKDFDTNSEFANRAIKTLFGANYEDARHLEDKSGRFIFDNPLFREAFAAIGREMGEGSLGGAVSESDRAALGDQINASRAKQSELQAQGKGREANEEYQKEMALIAKANGNQGIVGAGRTA